MRKSALLFFLLALLNGAAFAYSYPFQEKWTVYFNNEEDKSLKHFNPIILEPDHHPSLTPLIALNKTLIAYLSLGEVCVTRSYFEQAKESGVLLGPNPYSPGSWYVDIRNPAWQTLLIEKVIPSLLEQGFNGLCLDMLDIPLYLESLNHGFHGMKEAAIKLIFKLHETFPELTLVLQRAYSLLEFVAGCLDFALGDSVLTTYNPATHSYHYTSLSEYERQARALHAAQNRHYHLSVLTLDFWDAGDTTTLNNIYRVQRQNGFRPYVAPAGLQQIVHEPQK